MRLTNEEWIDDDGNDTRKTPANLAFGGSSGGSVLHALNRSGVGSGVCWSARCGQCTSRINAIKKGSVRNYPEGYEFDLCTNCADGGPSVRQLTLKGCEVGERRSTGGKYVLRITDPEVFAENHCPPSPWSNGE